MKKKKQQKRDGTHTKRCDAVKSKSSTAASIPQRVLPSPETLAMIAATVAKGNSVAPQDAVADAAQLYDAACEYLKGEAIAEAELESWAVEDQQIPQPKKFPARFDEFLRVIVGGKTTADRTKRFRDYLRFLKHTDDEVIAELERNRGYDFDQDSWNDGARRFRYWWKEHISEKARCAAMQRKKIKKSA